ncbi:MAG: ATP-binding cassette domain-containing protein [Holosporales bacterium]|jgi:polar amino acid transport system ATP-binding protein|nr:ATP-binding cassette domain-containing protein [Holosporales bacterium]
MLKIHNVYKSFNNTKVQEKVLENINLEIETASVLGLAGPSGSGKSTLLRCIQKLENIDSGSIVCDGRVCFMFQDFQLFPHMTVEQNLTYAPSLKNKDKKEDYKEQAKSMLQTLGIESKANEYPRTLSGGEKQRVALARSLMISPDILLCDEPTSGLDIASSEDVVSLLKSVNKLGVTLIIASHDLDFLLKISDRIVLLKNGSIVMDIAPREHTDSLDKLKGYY